MEPTSPTNGQRISAGASPARGQPHIRCPACSAWMPLAAGTGKVGQKRYTCPRCGTDFGLETEGPER